jgi:hypothetical protein
VFTAAGIEVIKTPPQAPQAEARIERPMPYIRDSYWRGREFTCLDAMQAAALDWCRDVAGCRSCQPLGGAAPASVFAAAEAQALQPLPVRPFVLASWSSAMVGPDIHAKVGKTIYFAGTLLPAAGNHAPSSGSAPPRCWTVPA